MWKSATVGNMSKVHLYCDHYLVCIKGSISEGGMYEPIRVETYSDLFGFAQLEEKAPNPKKSLVGQARVSNIHVSGWEERLPSHAKQLMWGGGIMRRLSSQIRVKWIFTSPH